MLGHVAMLASKRAMFDDHLARLNVSLEQSRFFASVHTDFDRLSLSEKCRFTLGSLVVCNLDGDVEMVFVQLIGSHDGKRVAQQVGHVPNERFRSEFGLNEERIRQIREILARIAHYPPR